MVCYFCGQKLEMGGVVGRHEICPQCHRDVRCCLNCALHDPGAHNQCREPQSEEVRERDQSNFCEFFALVMIKNPLDMKIKRKKPGMSWIGCLKNRVTS